MLDAAAEREVSKMAGALARLRAAATADDSGFAQGQLVNEMYRRTAELKVLLPTSLRFLAAMKPHATDPGGGLNARRHCLV